MKKFKILFSVFFIFPFILFSNVHAKNYKVTLPQAIQIALQNNQKIKISQANINIAEAMYKQAVSANYPSLNYNLKATRLDEAPMFQMRGSIDTDNTKTIALYNQLAQGYTNAATNFALAGKSEAAGASSASSTIFSNLASSIPAQSSTPFEVDVQVAGRDTLVNQLEFMMPLYTGGKISSLIKQAKLGKRIASKTKKRTLNEVVFDIKRYYYALILTQKLKKLSSDTLSQMNFIQKLTSKLYQGGSLKVKKTDYLRSKLSVSMVKSFHESILEKEALAKSALIFAMGLSWQDTVEIADTSFEKPVMDANLKDIIQNAYKFNPQINTLRLAVDVQDSKIDEAYSSYYPQIGIVGSIQNIQNDYEYGLVNDSTKNSWTLGIGVSLNLFDGMRTANKVAQNKIEKKKLQQQQFLLEEGLALQLKSAFLKMNSNYKRYNILKDSVDIAKENEELNSRAYQEDMVDTKDVIESQFLESLTIADYYRNLHEYALSKATIDFIIGSSLENSDLTDI